ncbi:hypothetical protein CU666_20485 [Pseudomonas syringae pv. actinidifoliorum]|nr:hypothetical protein [Pseudomonas syringae pv. actinidifoliorum]
MQISDCKDNDAHHSAYNAASAEQPLTSWQPGQPIPRPEVVLFEEYENYRERPPEGLEIEDVELIWWLVAANFTYQALREKLTQVVAQRRDWGCFIFSPIADLDRNGRYPTAIVDLLIDILPRGSLMSVKPEDCEDAEEPCEVVGSFIIQVEIWHDLTWTALGSPQLRCFQTTCAMPVSPGIWGADPAFRISADGRSLRLTAWVTTI